VTRSVETKPGLAGVFVFSGNGREEFKSNNKVTLKAKDAAGN